MSFSKDPLFLRGIIMDNYDKPNKKKDNIPQDYIKTQNKSETCIDDITVYIKKNGDIIEDILFNGVGCAISTSSTNIMANALISKTVNEAFEILDNYFNMINGKQYNEDILNELIAFHTIHEQTNRIKCALIGVNAIYNCLKEAK